MGRASRYAATGSARCAELVLEPAGSSCWSLALAARAHLSRERVSAKHHVLAAEADGHVVEEATVRLAPPMVEDWPPAPQTEASRPRQRQVDRLAVVLLGTKPVLTQPRAELHRAEGSRRPRIRAAVAWAPPVHVALPVAGRTTVYLRHRHRLKPARQVPAPAPGRHQGRRQ